MIIYFLGPSRLGERLFDEGLVGIEGNIECRLNISTKAPVCGRKSLTGSWWMNLCHKRIDAPNLTYQSTQRRDTFKVRSTIVMLA